MDKPLTKKQIKAMEEKKLREKMGEKAYAQKQVSRKTELMAMYNFVTMFLLIGMGVACLMFVAFYVLVPKLYNLVCLILFSTLFLASVVCFFLWKCYYSKKMKREIEENKKIIKEIIAKENDKQLKIAEQLKRQRKDVI